MASTPAYMKEYPNLYVFMIDTPGLKSGDIKVHVEDSNVLVISGERKREEEKEGAKYLRMETMVGKFMHKFVLPVNANTDVVLAVCQDGVLNVTVETLPNPQPKKPITIEALTVTQIYQIRDNKYGSQIVSNEQTASLMRAIEMVNGDNRYMASNSFLLDDDLRIPFSAKDVDMAFPPIDLDDIDLPLFV